MRTVGLVDDSELRPCFAEEHAASGRSRDDLIDADIFDLLRIDFDLDRLAVYAVNDLIVGQGEVLIRGILDAHIGGQGDRRRGDRFAGIDKGITPRSGRKFQGAREKW